MNQSPQEDHTSDLWILHKAYDPTTEAKSSPLRIRAHYWAEEPTTEAKSLPLSLRAQW